MLCEKIENAKEFSGAPEIPAYITDNLKFPLYDWQTTALENFLINETARTKKIEKGEKLFPNHLMFNMATGSGKTLVMAALILYYYKEKGITDIIFFVNQNAIVGKTQDNFINKSHAKYLYKENIVIDGGRVNIREVEQFSNAGTRTGDIQIKFTTIHKLHNDIYKENENSLLLSDLQKRNLVLIGDEAHHLNATTSRAASANDSNPTFGAEEISYLGKLSGNAKDADVERSWETTVCHYILNRGKKSFDSQNKNVLLEFTATVPETEEVQKKYEDKVIIKFDLEKFVEAGCTKHIRLVRSTLEKRERILQALAVNWYRHQIALEHDIPNFKPVILFRNKTISESQSDFDEFIEMCQNVKASDFNFLSSYKNHIKTDDEIPNAYSAGNDIFKNMLIFMKQHNFTNSTIRDYVKENFTERNCIITNSKTNKTQTEKTDAKIDRLLNSLEDVHNHIRAVFTVQRLTEGWDVLNLYDIVRLYSGRDTDYKKGKVGKHTTSEVQLIGRGVRYYPFSYENKSKNFRKFDSDMQNELRVLEEFYFHSDSDERYISDLSNALKKKGLMTDEREEKRFAIKKEFQDDFKKMYLLCNKKIENENRRLKTLPDDFAKLNFSYTFDQKTSTATSVNMSGEDENLSGTKQASASHTDKINIVGVPKNIVQKAIHQLNSDGASYYSFENLKKRFNINSMTEFLNFIKPVPMELIFQNGNDIANETPSELLRMTKDFFMFCQCELEKYDQPYKATEFELVPFESCFPFETVRMINTKNTDYAENKRFENKCVAYSWYALDSFYGTSEERELVEFIFNHYSNLKSKYDRVCLLRNEEVYKIFDFDTGAGFQPDFLLLLQGKNGCAYFQIFIEVKGKHLAGEDNDGWKEKFLESISKRYGLAKPFKHDSGKYVLFGLPFFNKKDSEMYNKFAAGFEDTLGVDAKDMEYAKSNDLFLQAASGGARSAALHENH